MPLHRRLAVPMMLLASSPAALAMELDTLLPAGIPGFGTGPEITVLSRLQRGDQSQVISLAGLTISPELDAAAGYDSAPNAAPGGSALLNLSPSLAAADPAIGLGAYAAWQSLSYPQNPAQGSRNYQLAIGQAAILAHNTITLAAAQLSSQQSGFSLEPSARSARASITGTALRASDAFTTGMIIATPKLSYTTASSSAAPGQTATQTQAGLTLQIIPDGVLQLIIYGNATNLSYTQTAQNAADYTALFGLSDTAEGLWDIRLAAGFTTRAPTHGKSTIIPITEAAADWMPDDLTSITLTAAHEIDDPDRIDTASYTITEAKCSIAHEYLRNVILTASASITHAASFATPLIETISQTATAIAWRLNPHLKLTAEYDFNDRQANHLRAANEHVASMTLAWSL